MEIITTPIPEGKEKIEIIRGNDSHDTQIKLAKFLNNDKIQAYVIGASAYEYVVKYYEI